MDPRFTLRKSTAGQYCLVLLVSSSDGKTPVTDLSSATIKICKGPLGSFDAPHDGTFEELSNGWYTIILDATDTATEGPLVLHVEATGACNYDALFTVMPAVVYDREFTSTGFKEEVSASMCTSAGIDSEENSVIDILVNQIMFTWLDQTIYSLLSALPAAVWDELLAGHTIEGSAAEALATAGGGQSAEQIAAEILDASVASHKTAGTVGGELHLAKAMMANKKLMTVETGVIAVKDDNGTDTLVTLTPTEADGVVTITPS